MKTQHILAFTFAIYIYRATALFERPCCEELDLCYNGPPWSSIERPVPAPACRTEVNTTFYLDRENTTRLVLWPEIKLDGTPYNSSQPTIIITHGFMSNGNKTWMLEMAETLYEKYQGEVNVIRVGWSEGADTINYLASVSNTRVVGAEIGRFIKYLYQHYQVSPYDIYLIGHSLGAHIMAYASNRAGTVGRITGLDPAQPLFEYLAPELYLDKEDACYVDAMHTDARLFIPFLGFGFIQPIGIDDYYVNGGIFQPGCVYPDPVAADTSPLEILNNTINELYSAIACPHTRATQYYIETILPTCVMWGHTGSKIVAFIASLGEGNITTFPKTFDECTLDSCSPMGLPATSYPASGSFVVVTALEEPYCLPEPNVTIQMERDLEGTNYKSKCTFTANYET